MTTATSQRARRAAVNGTAGERGTSKPGPRSIRCAIYTRKSTEEGLNQEFNSLDAQRESAIAYIASQKNEGWQCLSEKYDDGGFTGGNIERPAHDDAGDGAMSEAIYRTR